MDFYFVMAEFIIIGTSHISRESVSLIAKVIEEKKPDFVAVELDVRRLHALLTHQKGSLHIRDVFRVGFKGFLFAVIGSLVQRKLGKLVGLEPGSDMLQAVRMAQRHGIQLLLIDQDIEVTLRRFSQAFSWKEKFRFIADMVKGLLFPRAELKKYGLGDIDLRKVPPAQLVDTLIGQLKVRYPNLYQVLIAERNAYMIKKLKRIGVDKPDARVVVVVGAGHQRELEKALA